MSYRIGSGVDFHQLVEGRELWIGGVKLDHYKGALGHSDADVLLHAICDAILGAAGLGDIGSHFPDTDSTYKNIDSKVLLKKTFDLVSDRFVIVNLDCTVCLQVPIMRPSIPAMQEVISNMLNITKQDVSIKATTTEKMGFVGREEGVVAYASVLLKQKDQ